MTLADNGNLRGGLSPSDFVTTIITADDAAKTTFAVAASAQLAGVYFFDVTSAFLLAHGAGQYNIVVVIDTSLGSNVQPPVLDVHSEVLIVSVYDIDALAGTGATSIAAAVWSKVVDGTLTAEESVRLMNAILGGKVSGAGTGTETFRDADDTKNRIVSTVDANGNRTAIARDLA